MSDIIEPEVVETVEEPAETVVVVETPAPAPVRAPRPGDRPIQTVGRRKEAIVRVRLIPGTGKIVCNGRDLEKYFPSKVHQQLIREPLTTAEKAGFLTRDARVKESKKYGLKKARKAPQYSKR